MSNSQSDNNKNSPGQARKLAAILFADIVGYTALMQKDETKARLNLEKFRDTLNEKVALHKGLVVNNYGDGCLCTFDSAVDAMNCAKEVQVILQTDPKVPVRMGLHSGDVFLETDNVYGDSVNIASRIESLGVAGAILFSDRIKNDISNQREFQVHELGNFEFKNVEKPMAVYALANNGLVIPKPEEMRGKLKKPNTQKRFWIVPVILAILLSIVFGFWKTNTTSETTAETETIPNNSLAVLPFTNMSDEKENEYFTNGMHDDLLTQLSKIGSMKVISRTSVLRFKNTEESIPAIAIKLGVKNILEGSVQRSGNQVRVNVQLINADTDSHLWSEVYDRELTANNVFDIQSEIAKEIATVLNTTLSDSEQQAIAELPTDNLEAYEAYLRGRQLIEERIPKSIMDSKAFLEKAIALDPNFAQAYVKLGEAHYLSVEYALEDSKTNYKLAWEYCEKAKSLNDKLPEIYGLESTLYHYDKGDIEKSGEAYQKAITINPNYADAYFWYAHALFEISRDFEQAINIMQNAIRLNPLSPKFINMMGIIQGGSGQIEKSIQSYRKATELSPNYSVPAFNVSRVYSFEGRLDSAVLNAYGSLTNNPNNTQFLSNYIFRLGELEMDSEINQEMDQIGTDNRYDSLAIFYIKRHRAFLHDDLIQAERYTHQIMELDEDALSSNPTLEYDVYYYQKKYHKVIDLFERRFPDVLNTDYFENYMFSGYNFTMPLQDGIQKYIFSLIQIDQKKKAFQILDKYLDRILANNNEKGEARWESRFREFFKVRNFIIQGKNDLAMEQFSKYFGGKLFPGWHYALLDPIFDEFRNDARFLQVVSDMKTEVGRQRETVRRQLQLKN